MTALHAAVYTKGKVSSLALAVLLIEAGADVDLKDKVRPVHAWIGGYIQQVVMSNGVALCNAVCSKVGHQWTSRRLPNSDRR